MRYKTPVVECVSSSRSCLAHERVYTNRTDFANHYQSFRKEADVSSSEPRLTVAEYCRDCGVRSDVRCFVAMDVDGDSLVMYDKNSFQRDTSLRAWKRRWAMLKKWFAGNLIDVRFVDMSFTRCEQEVSYYHRLRNAIDARMEIKDEDPQL